MLGYPILVAPDMPDIGANSVPICLGDFKAAYWIVDRFGVRVVRDPYTSKPAVLFYTTKRVGGGSSGDFFSIKLVKCA